MLHIHWHKFVGVWGAWRYYECRCGARQAHPIQGIGGPPDRDWISGKRKEFRGYKPVNVIKGKVKY